MKKLKNVGFIIGTVLLLAACLCAVIILLVPNSSAKYAASSTATGTVSITYSNEIKCTGGTADCDSLAVCEICGNEYGSYHHSGTETWEYDEEYHWQIWSCCRIEISEKAAHSYTEGLCACGRQSHYHIYELVEETAAGCTTTGTAAHYVCTNGCDLLFDAETKAEITAASLVIEAKGHSYNSTVTEPTCTAAGYTTYKCSGCGDTYTGNEVEALGHDYSSSVTAPTCTAAGYTTYTCTRCKDSYTGNNIAALGHNYSSTVTAPTCTEKGYTTHTCTQCNDNYVDTYVDANGHTATNGGTEVVHTKCSVCKAVISSDHSYSSKVTTAATCGATGIKTYSCTCGYSYTEPIAATGNHSYPSTYQKDSSGHWKKCSVCENTTASTSHGYSDACDTTCDTCGYTRTAPHNLNYGYYITKPTCSAAGVRRYYCRGCDYTYDSTESAYPHRYVQNTTATSGEVKCADCGGLVATPKSFLNPTELATPLDSVGYGVEAVGHSVRFTGTSSASTKFMNHVDANCWGRYLVIKYRVDTVGTANLYTTYYDNKVGNNGNCIVTTTYVTNGNWQIKVIDMQYPSSQATGLGVTTYLGIATDYQGKGGKIDIAFVASFDTYETAEMYRNAMAQSNLLTVNEYIDAHKGEFANMSAVGGITGRDNAAANYTVTNWNATWGSSFSPNYRITSGDNIINKVAVRGHSNIRYFTNPNACYPAVEFGWVTDMYDVNEIHMVSTTSINTATDVENVFGTGARRYCVQADLGAESVDIGFARNIYIVMRLDDGTYIVVAAYTIGVDKLSDINYGYVKTGSGGGVYLRSEASSSATQLASLPDGAKVEIIERLDNGWLHVSYNGTEGYISGIYCVDAYSPL